jgi:alginate O-acetyltransferase complex protein AlgI
MIPDSWHFDFFYSVWFWAALAVVTALIRLVGGRPRARAAALLGSSVVMLLALPQFSLRDLLLVGAATLGSLVVARALCRPPRADGDPPSAGGRRWIALLGVAAIIGFLCYFKYHQIQDLFSRDAAGQPPSASRYLPLLGVSYFSFKALHVVVEAYRREIQTLHPLTFFAYMVFFPAFISGPINRYPHFAAQLTGGDLSPWRQDLAQGGRRIIDGLFKKFVLVTLLFPHVLPTQSAALATMTPGRALVGLWAYALYIYFDFAGYSDLAIGSARIMGVELPENFNWPFIHKNIREAWANWHMSLTSWLVDYIYFPVVRRLRPVEFFRSRPVLLSIVGMNVTFVACGMWHGESLHFLAWGAYHGLGLSALTIYERQKRRIRLPALRRYFASPVSRWVGTLATFNYFAVSLPLFVLDLPQLKTLAATLLGAP